MVNYREILRLHALGYSQRSIESSVRSSHQKVKEVLDRAEKMHIEWPLDEGITNAVLHELLGDKHEDKPSVYAPIDYEYIHNELSKKGVTLSLLWSEYCDKARINGQKPYMSITHKPGEAMQVDWAGGTIPYFDPITGEEYKAYLFVAALPCSCYIYVEACDDMKQETWSMCHVHAYEYFSGVTRLLVPDNLKTGITSNTRYETQLNESYRDMAEYYGTAIVPARVRKPQDKGLVENSVGFTTTWITAALRDRRFFSFAEVREAEAYLSEEKEFMLPLPKYPYEPAVWKQAKVGNDYLISDGLNKYSVPFDLIGEQVQIRLTKNMVEVYFKGSRITSHKRLGKFSIQPVVRTEHTPSKHREYLKYNADEFRMWSKNIGSSTKEVVRYFLTSGSAPEQGHKACVSLKSLCKRYGKKKLEAACERMLVFSSSPSVRTISTILKNSKEEKKPDEENDNSNKYGTTRGAAYRKKGGDGND